MTREELKKRCEVLAGVGDTQAIATLELFKALDNPYGPLVDKMRNDFLYIVSRIKETVELGQLLLKTDLPQKEVERLVTEHEKGSIQLRLDNTRDSFIPLDMQSVANACVSQVEAAST